MSSSSVLYGSCHCGGVRFSSTLLPLDMAYCHCRDCCRISGSPCLWARFDSSSSAMIWSAASTLRAYRCSDFAERGSCGTCGSVVYMQYWHQHGQYIHIAAGLFEDASIQGTLPPPECHIFASTLR